jgi:hypothetical protein
VGGEGLATGFIRPSQPMIRYRIGDRASFDDNPSDDGRHIPVIHEVTGRKEDTIYGVDGQRLIRFHGIFVDQPNIRAGQIIQKSLDHIHVKVVPKLGFNRRTAQRWQRPSCSVAWLMFAVGPDGSGFRRLNARRFCKLFQFRLRNYSAEWSLRVQNNRLTAFLSVNT